MPFPAAVFTPTSLSLPKISLLPFDTGLSFLVLISPCSL